MFELDQERRMWLCMLVIDAGATLASRIGAVRHYGSRPRDSAVERGATTGQLR